MIIGTQKGGTSILSVYMRRHPTIVPAVQKELHFFDRPKYRKGKYFYFSEFPLPKLDKLGSKQITGEATPDYLFHPHAPARIKELFPDTKFIVLLRNPSDRAYAHYNHEVRNKREPLPSFEEAVNAEPERLRGELEKMLSDPTYESEVRDRKSYLERGKYQEQLQRWFDLFPREQFLIFKSEDFFVDPQSVLKEIWQFLDLPEWYPEQYSKYKQSYSSIDPQLREKLMDYFRPYNEKLYEYLGRDFGWH
ncbi:sulfotransferase [Geitlerinema sp. PCC 9228]|uniref:sulfotransferase family protein n=1 Tax=Geitlerinema sp. PCC 9228 TaxID=111611 RepID=UPI00147E4255|nr:sulfotransferase [Geitlerinema sp. PCC 9228]